MAEKSSPVQINQVGIVVEDLAKAIKYYESLGIGPFELNKFEFLSRELWGKSVPPDRVLIKAAQAQVGEIYIELIQPIAEGTHWMEFLKKKGEGINHLGLVVDDIDKEETKLAGQGFKIIYRSRFRRADGSIRGAAYFDTAEVGGVLFEPRGLVVTGPKEE